LEGERENRPRKNAHQRIINHSDETYRAWFLNKQLAQFRQNDGLLFEKRCLADGFIYDPITPGCKILSFQAEKK